MLLHELDEKVTEMSLESYEYVHAYDLAIRFLGLADYCKSRGEVGYLSDFDSLIIGMKRHYDPSVFSCRIKKLLDEIVTEQMTDSCLRLAILGYSSNAQPFN